MSSDWIYNSTNTSTRSKYKKIYEYISSKLDGVAVADSEEVEVNRIVADAVGEARLHGAPAGDSLPTSARVFYDDYMSCLDIRTDKKRRRSGGAGGVGGDPATGIHGGVRDDDDDDDDGADVPV